MNIVRVLNASKDVVAKFRTSRYPLRNVAQEIIAQRKLNSKERKTLLDTVFRFSREGHLFNAFLKDCVPFSKSMPVGQKDNLLLELILNNHEKLKKLAKDFEAWLITLSDNRFLKALGPLLQQKIGEQFQNEAQAVARGLFSKPAIYLAVDQTKLNLSELTDVLISKNIAFFFHPFMSDAIGLKEFFDIESLPAHIKKHVFFMDAGSQIITSLINPTREQMVLDMCAGEGNKALLIAKKPSNYVAADLNEKRLKKAKVRLQDKNVQFVVSDGRLLSYQNNTFDWIILDAPCTGTGTVRRHPDVLHRLSLKDVFHYQTLQRELLVKASALLKPGGVLVYATCSILKEENQDQIEWMLKEHIEIHPYPLSHLGVDLVLAASSNYSFQLLPHVHNCDGFYCAILSKK